MTSPVRASLQIASVSGMIAPARRDWTLRWREKHSRRYGLSEEQVQVRLEKRGHGKISGELRTVPAMNVDEIEFYRKFRSIDGSAGDRLVQIAG